MASRKRGLGLGRSLDELLGDGAPAAGGETEGELRTLAIAAIVPGKFQPRVHFDEGALDELAASIKAQGLIQPIVVRETGKGRYELIAGERRWRAARKAGLQEVPALVKAVPEQAVVAMALIENIQREDLSPLEEAKAIERLIGEFGLTHQHAADAIGRSRASVTNLLRLLELPAPIRDLLDRGQLQMGHARALAAVEPAARAIALARQAAEQDWSVRELEEAARRVAAPAAGKSTAPAARRDPNIDALERELAERLATRVQLAHARNGRGKLVIHYHSLDELDGILGRIR
ncbi:MAG: ParB/RepB/Spo0J family partition protein [Dokdonella sp.]|uniref:ParB/RepB/Spo0J family partition protein n=2 Tax=Dokdonella sp. TaxID=2291710 RepID=UPI0025BE34A9|nr:ParB/RepB/Spo0J family partition protein [Dokdonella sp.]MBX3700393.1 ParB/RepB/Spo0J family partition protein [Dokdonella sp.]MCW5579485.1 ParB/RepB/Spo0J family partition protein [Dokdonella sp.]